MRRLAAILAAVVMLFATPALAVLPDEVLADPALEARAREISAGLRCLVCQNQSIDDSNAELARDLRLVVRERLVAGDSNEAVRQYVVDRYGEYVLLQPVLALHTLVLWVAAPLLLIAGLAGLFLAGRRRSIPPAPGLTAEEGEALARLEAEAREP